jgi:acyl-CoA thioester hydrolase
LGRPFPEQGYRVIYADTDALGMVYHARYLEMAERARNYALEVAGIRITRLTEENNLILVVYRAAMEFIAPLRVDDEVVLRTGIVHQQISRVLWRTEIVLNDVQHALVDVTTVCFDLEKRGPVSMPHFLEKALRRLPCFDEEVGEHDL